MIQEIVKHNSIIIIIYQQTRKLFKKQK